MSTSRFLALVLVPVLGLVPIAPPEHVHEGEDHGQEHTVVHRHVAAHTDQHHSDHDGTFDEDDGPVVTLNPVYTVRPASPGVAAPPVAVLPALEPLVVTSLERHSDYIERLIHGPPRAPTGLRAPPTSSRL